MGGGAAGAIAGGMVARAGGVSGTVSAAEAEAATISRAGAVSTAVRISAASAGTVAGYGNERLLEVRRRIWERRGCTPDSLPDSTEGEEETKADVEWDDMRSDLEEMGLDPDHVEECAICLEDALTVPGISRVHLCGKGCHNN